MNVFFVSKSPEKNLSKSRSNDVLIDSTNIQFSTNKGISLEIQVRLTGVQCISTHLVQFRFSVGDTLNARKIIIMVLS